MAAVLLIRFLKPIKWNKYYETVFHNGAVHPEQPLSNGEGPARTCEAVQPLPDFGKPDRQSRGLFQKGAGGIPQCKDRIEYILEQIEVTKAKLRIAKKEQEELKKELENGKNN